MLIKAMNARVSRFVSIIVTLALVFTILSISPSPVLRAAHADVPTGDTSRINLVQASQTETSITLQAVVGQQLLEHETIELYSSTSDQLIEEKEVGESVTFDVPVPGSELHAYYVKVDDASSNIVVTYPSAPEWKVSLTSLVQNFDTDAHTPKLKWMLNQPVISGSGRGIYIADSNSGELIFRAESAKQSGEFTIPRFYTESHKEYMAYVADYNANISSNSELVNVVAISDSVKIYRTPWELELQIDLPEFTTSSTPMLTWTSNQGINGANYEYAIYLVDETTGKILQRIDNIYRNKKTGAAYIERFYYGGPHTYRAYIAKNDPDIISVSELSDIQAQSNFVSTKRADWTISLSIDKESFNAGSFSPVLRWSTNQRLFTNDSYSVYIVDETDDVIIRRLTDGSYSSSELPINRFYAGGPHTYRAYVAKTDPNAVKPSDLQDIQAESNTVSTARGAWTINLSIDRIQFSTSSFTPRVKWVTNQPIQTNKEYAVYVVDQTTDKIISRHDDLNRTSLEVLIEWFYTGGPHTYKAYVAKNNPEATSGLELEDIQAESGTVSTERTPWTVTLTADKTAFFTGDFDPRLKWVTNQPILTNKEYAVYVVDQTADEIIARYDDLNRTHLEVPINRFYTGGPHTYKVYVAKNNPEATKQSDLRDIQAMSESVTISRAEWGVGLSSSITSVEMPTPKNNLSETHVALEHRWSTNQKISNTNYEYAVYVVDQSSGTILSRHDYLSRDRMSGSVTQRNLPVSEISHYRSYVAKNDANATHVSQLKDIQASSEYSFPDNLNGPMNSQEFAGGANPSSAECNQQCYGDPVNSVNGELFENVTDISLNSPIPLEFVRSYSSTRKDNNEDIGYGWTHNFDMKLTGTDGETLLSSGRIYAHQENGSTSTFYQTREGYTTNSHTMASLRFESTQNQFVLERKNGYSFYFDVNTGSLITVKDLNGNHINVSYSDGRITEVFSSNQQTLKFQYTDGGQISKVIANDGRIVSYAYDKNGNLSAVTPPGSSTAARYEYSDDHKITSLTNVLGGKTTNEYDASDRIIKQTDPLGNAIVFTYAGSSSSKSTTITLPDGTKNIEQYNAQNQLTSRTTAYGTPQAATTSYVYGAMGKQTQVISPTRRATHYAYDADGNIAKIVDPLNNATSFSYNEFGLVTEITDPLGNVTSFSYDDKGNLISRTSPTGVTSRTTYTTSGTKSEDFSPANLLDNNNKRLSYSYDSNGFVHAVTDEEGNSIAYVNSDGGLVQSSEDSLGRVVKFDYDPAGRVRESIAPNGASEKTEYNNAGLVTRQIDALGRETLYEYDSMGKAIRVTSPLGVNTFSYDERGQLVEEIDHAGRVTKYGYDKRGNVTSITDANGNVSIAAWNLDDTLASVTDPAGHTTSFFYDPNGNRIKVVDADGKEATADYNELNLLVASTNANGMKTVYSYDADERLIRTTHADGSYESQEYDDAGRLAKSVDSNESTTSFEYNSLDQISSTTDKSGQKTHYEYDSMGNVVRMIRPDQSSISYEYDSLDLISKISYDDWATVSIEYERDIAGRIIAVVKDKEVTSYAYDSIGNLTYRGPPSNEDGVQYIYNDKNEISSIIYPSGTRVDYEYDSNGNVLSTKINGEDIAANTFNALNIPSTTQYGNGVVETLQYNALGQVSEVTLGLNEQEFYSKDIDHGNSGLVISATTSRVDNTSAKKYTYDALERLSKVDTEDSNGQVSSSANYQFDTVNNLVSAKSATNTYNILGQITSQVDTRGSLSFEYDKRGNRTSSTLLPVPGGDDQQDEQTSHLEWNLDDTLKSVALNDLTVSYAYGPEGLLSERSIVTSDEDSSVENFAWNTLTGIPTMLSDGKRDYVYNGGAVPVAQLDRDTGELTYLHSDEQGSIVLLTDEGGEEIASYSYDAYGNPEDAHGDSDRFLTPFGYVGEYTDSETGFQFLRARWYDPSTSAFLSLDPAVLMTGEPYGYASANPISNTDPLGLFSLTQLGKSVNWKSVGKIATTVAVTAVTVVAVGACVAATAGVCAGAAAPMIIGGVNVAGGIVDYALTEECKFPGGWAVAAATSLIPGGKIGKLGSSVAKSARWKVGDDIGAKTIAGNDPSWRVIRSRYWKNEAQEASANPGMLTTQQQKRLTAGSILFPTRYWRDGNIARMQKGLAPQRSHPTKGFIESMELSHESIPQRYGGTTDVIQRWPEEHAAVDPYRRLGAKYD